MNRKFKLVYSEDIINVLDGLGIDDSIDFIRSLKQEIKEKYPESVTKNSEFFYDQTDNTLCLMYFRYETEDEFARRTQSDSYTKDLELAHLEELIEKYSGDERLVEIINRNVIV